MRRLTRRAREVALIYEAEGLAVHVTAGPEPDLPDDLEAAAGIAEQVPAAADQLGRIML